VAKKNSLVVVESVAKARTIEKFLGKGYTVRACLGHVRDLPKSALGVDVEHDFAPKYLVPKEKKDVVKALRDMARGAETVYLATDPDREGEAIAWHLVDTLGLEDRAIRRIEFHEVTRDAIQAALKSPRGIDSKRVDAQQARRILDRLVGFKLSPLLWSKVRPGLSAGRVQSVAVRLIVDREREIAAFVPVEYWTLEADLSKQGSQAKADRFRAMVVEREGKRLQVEVGADGTDQGRGRTVAGFKTREEAEAAEADLKQAVYRVAEIKRTDRTRNPAAPFTTSTLQQEAARKLGFTATRTMRVAQQLYEGVDIGGGETVGLITYMRTDSTNVAESAVQEVRGLIAHKFGQEYVAPTARVYRTRSRLAQEAHEAVRPTLAAREPESLRAHLSPEQFRLYDLVWKRFVASQMASARFDVTTVEIDAAATGRPRYRLRATGSVLRFPGFLTLYTEGRDDDSLDDEGRPRLPELSPQELLDLLGLLPEQHFTQPPPRYTEATLVKALEERGIGRPSTYAPILQVIQGRQYVEKVDKRFAPTELGEAVNDLLVQNFPDVLDVEFTAGLEEKLDDVANGQTTWVPVVRDFYGPFEAILERVTAELPRVKIPDELTDEICEKCGVNRMAIKVGRYGRFLGCSGFPACKSTKPILNKVGVDCPECGGDLVERRGGRWNRVFYGCAQYPACNFSTRAKPVQDRCPQCGWLQVEAGRDKLRCLRCNPEPGRGRANGSTRTATAATRNGRGAAGSATRKRATTRRGASASGRGGRVVSGTRSR
jgi:DNA topoisomerase-1